MGEGGSNLMTLSLQEAVCSLQVKGVHSIIIGKTVVPGDKLDMDIGQ